MQAHHINGGLSFVFHTPERFQIANALRDQAKVIDQRAARRDLAGPAYKDTRAALRQQARDLRDYADQFTQTEADGGRRTWHSPNGVDHGVEADGRCVTCGRIHYDTSGAPGYPATPPVVRATSRYRGDTSAEGDTV